jgi:predicted nucleic acid-binding protein
LIIVDTSVWVDFLRGIVTRQTDWLDSALGRQRLALLDIILCEVLQGIEEPRKAAQVKKDLLTLSVLGTGGSEMAVAAADHYQVLRRKGFTVRKTIDCWIATFCLREGHSLLHSDRDFHPFENHLGLRVVST